MIRNFYLEQIRTQLRIQPICALLGPRQVGKTTLARQLAELDFLGSVEFFDLENPADLKRLDQPMFALSNLTANLIVIDEIQYRPNLFPILRVLVDQPNFKTKFLILGSASRDLIAQSSETLAGRIGYIELPPFALFEVGHDAKLMLRGGFPRAYLSESDSDASGWLQNYIMTFLERDIPNLGFHIPPLHLHRFWLMLAHYHGQTMNFSELGRSLMISDQTVRRYLDILAGTFMIRILPPWFENLGKRQVKAPKIYFRDSGLLNRLLLITSQDELHRHPKLGAIWEGFALEEIIRFWHLRAEEVFFWSTHLTAEIDLLVFAHGKRIGFEFKYTDTPQLTKSIHTTLNDLRLDHIYLIYPGTKHYALNEQVTACGLSNWIQDVAPHR